MNHIKLSTDETESGFTCKLYCMHVVVDEYLVCVRGGARPARATRPAGAAPVPSHAAADAPQHASTPPPRHARSVTQRPRHAAASHRARLPCRRTHPTTHTPLPIYLSPTDILF